MNHIFVIGLLVSVYWLAKNIGRANIEEQADANVRDAQYIINQKSINHG